MFGWFKRKPRTPPDGENVVNVASGDKVKRPLDDVRPTAGMQRLGETALSDLFVHGELHSPYFIFLRCAGRHSDAELLHRFGLSRFRRTNAGPRFSSYVILADDGQWTLIADDWHYTLWHMPSTRPTLAALGEACDVFACSVGDCDLSFDFVYYHDSRLARRYVVEDPHFQGGAVVEDFGKPLPGESTAFKQSDHLKICLGIAASLGIKTDYTEGDIRVYAPFNQRGR